MYKKVVHSLKFITRESMILKTSIRLKLQSTFSKTNPNSINKGFLSQGSLLRVKKNKKSTTKLRAITVDRTVYSKKTIWIPERGVNQNTEDMERFFWDFDDCRNLLYFLILCSNWLELVDQNRMYKKVVGSWKNITREPIILKPSIRLKIQSTFSKTNPKFINKGLLFQGSLLRIRNNKESTTKLRAITVDKTV